MDELYELLHECLPFVPEHLQERIQEKLNERFELVWVNDAQLDDIILYERNDECLVLTNKYLT